MNEASLAVLLWLQAAHRNYRQMLEEAHSRERVDPATTAQALNELNERRLRLSLAVSRANGDVELSEIMLLTFPFFGTKLPPELPPRSPQASPGDRTLPPAVKVRLDRLQTQVDTAVQQARQAGIAESRVVRFAMQMVEARGAIEEVIVGTGQIKLPEKLLDQYELELKDRSRELWDGLSLA